MRSTLSGLLLAASLPIIAQAQALDAPYPGTMTLNVDATDTEQGIFRVTQTIPVAAPGPMTLNFPKWLPGNHAPRGQIEKLAGLTIRAGGRVLPWKRDPVDVYAFHVDVPAGAWQLDLAFKFLSATEEDQGRIVVSPEIINLQWQSVSLYPAGWATRRIPVSASLTLPAGWRAGTALRPQSAATGARIAYATVDYETLVDSPVFAGKYFRAEPLGSNVTLNIVADQVKYLAATPAHIEVHRRLVDQAVKLFGARPFDHYDLLLGLTERIGSIGLEHHRSSENIANPEYFTEWASGPGRRNLLAHEFSHSWVGKYRRPAGQMVPDFATPLVDDLLWVYEGQDQFWGYVLGARAGLFSKAETLDALASIAAGLDVRRGRDWRNLSDTTYDPIITARRPKGWVSYQRSEDYYNEGLLIWLETDAMIRAQTGGAKGMDDFARAFFGGEDGDFRARGFSFDEVVATLNAVAPYDWAGFLKQRTTGKAASAPLGGINRGGYRLVYTEEPTPFFRDKEKRAAEIDLSFSIGLTIGKGGKVNSVIWDGPAFYAGLTSAAEIVAVNGQVYSDEAMLDAISVAKGGSEPIRLIVRSGNRVRDIPVTWNGGLRYPRLEKAAAGEASLDVLLRPRP
jgi:predicted metalloprotease with PDZ domain